MTGEKRSDITLKIPKLIGLGSLIAVVGLLVAILDLPVRAIQSWRTITEPTDARIVVVGVTFSPLEEFQFTKMEVAVRNTGKKVAIIKTVVFHIEEVWRLRPAALAAIPLPPSATYDVMLPLERSSSPYVVQVNVAQSVKPDDADKFALSLGNDASPHGEEYIVILRVELLYNEESVIANAGRVALLIRHRSLMRDSLPEGHYKNCTFFRNRDYIELVSQLEREDKTLIMNQRLKELITAPLEATCEY